MLALQRIVFQSQSPDEIAFLEALHRCGITLFQRAGNSVKLQLSDPHGSLNSPARESIIGPDIPFGQRVNQPRVEVNFTLALPRLPELACSAGVLHSAG